MFLHQHSNLSLLISGKTSGPHLHLVLTSVLDDRITSGQPRKMCLLLVLAYFSYAVLLQAEKHNSNSPVLYLLYL